MRRDLVLLLAVACGALAGCDRREPADVVLGYVEADYVRIASPIAGQLARMHLERGRQVAAGAPAFVLESESERAGREEALHRVEQARRQLQDLRQGRRPDEIRALEAQVEQARAAYAASSVQFERTQKLVRAEFVSPAGLDEQRAAMQRDRGRLEEAQANLRQARQGARANQVAAAEQELQAAQAQAAQAEWRLQQKARASPVAAEVVDILYREGEFVPAGNPVATLLPPGNLKARFFVTQAQAGALALRQPVEVTCDGCGQPVRARVSFISPEVEYTAPLIYSREQRARLVVMVEARPEPADAARLHPGQPLQVRLLPKDPP